MNKSSNLKTEDIPFGVLNNDYNSPLVVDGSVYKSVNNYVYSHMVPINTIYRKSLEDIDPSNIKKTYDQVIQKLQNDVLSYSINRAIDAKIKTDPDFKNALMATGNNVLLYISKNKFLGFGKGSFINCYGNWLGHHRKINTPNNFLNDRTPHEIYDFYLCERGLVMALRHENLNEYLKAGTMFNLAKMLIKKYGNEKINVLNMQTAILLHKDRKIYSKPKNLIKYIQKTKIREILVSNKKIQKNLIFDVFIDYVISQNKKHPEIVSYLKNINFFKLSQLNTISLSEKNILINKVYSLYEEGIFPASLKNNIKEKISQIFIPSEEEILFFENQSVPPPTSEELNFTSGENAPPPTGFVKIYPTPSEAIKEGEKNYLYDILSPLNTNKSFILDNYEYPSISYYIVVSILQTIPFLEQLSDSYNIIKKQNSLISIDELEKIYQTIKNSETNKYLSHLFSKALSSKFDKTEFLDIFLSAPPNMVDPQIGQTINKFIPDIYKINSFSNLIFMADKDAFLINWINDKINDFCFTLKSYQIYKKRKNDTTTISDEFLFTFINTFYSNLKKQQNFNYKLPFVFESKVSEYFNIGSKSTSFTITYKQASYIYNQILELLFAIYTQLKSKDLNSCNFKAVLVHAQKYMSQQIHKTHVKFPVLDNRTDKFKQQKTISAILNIIRILNGGNYIVDGLDVLVAVGIINGKLKIDFKENQIIKTQQLVSNIEKEVSDIIDSKKDVYIEDDEFNDEENNINDQDEPDYEEQEPDYNDETEDEEEYIEGVSDLPTKPQYISKYLSGFGLSVSKNVVELILNASNNIIKNSTKQSFKNIKINYYG